MQYIKTDNKIAQCNQQSLSRYTFTTSKKLFIATLTNTACEQF